MHRQASRSARCITRRSSSAIAQSSPATTRPANDFNDENIFVVGSAYDEIKEPGRKPIKVDRACCKALALHVRTELERIFGLSEQFTPGS
jgi:hypothetical protein